MLCTMLVTSFFQGCSKANSPSTAPSNKLVVVNEENSDSKASTDKILDVEKPASTETKVAQVDKSVDDNITNMCLGLTYDNAVKLWGEPNMDNGYGR